jgi:hypothetical protein
MVNAGTIQSRTLAALLPRSIGLIWKVGRQKMPAIAAGSTGSRPLMLVALLLGALLAATLGLWAYHGTAVFFEIIRAGWIACF